MSQSLIAHLTAPCLLVAMPHLAGTPFAQAVVVLARHNDEGSMGLVINRPCGITQEAFVSGMGLTLSAGHVGDQQVHVGGPVDVERAFIVHDGPHQGPETEALMPQVALSYSMESLTALAHAPPMHWRICIGYSGWGKGQLAQEISRCDWLVAPAAKELIFQEPTHALWHAVLGSMGIEPLQLGYRTPAIH